MIFPPTVLSMGTVLYCVLQVGFQVFILSNFPFSPVLQFTGGQMWLCGPCLSFYRSDPLQPPNLVAAKTSNLMSFSALQLEENEFITKHPLPHLPRPAHTWQCWYVEWAQNSNWKVFFSYSALWHATGRWTTKNSPDYWIKISWFLVSKPRSIWLIQHRIKWH